MEILFTKIVGCSISCLIPSEKMPSIQLYISQAALKNAKDSTDGVDKEITSLQAEIEVNMPLF